MVRLRMALGSNTESGVPYTDEEIDSMARKGKHGGTFPVVGGYIQDGPEMVLIPPLRPRPQCNAQIKETSGYVEKAENKNKYLTQTVKLDMISFLRSDDKCSQMLRHSNDIKHREFGIESAGAGGDDEIAVSRHTIWITHSYLCPEFVGTQMQNLQKVKAMIWHPLLLKQEEKLQLPISLDGRF
ncbi:hypothetical protein Tco_1320394 [Tanacetum coccineum]